MFTLRPDVSPTMPWGDAETECTSTKYIVYIVELLVDYIEILSYSVHIDRYTLFSYDKDVENQAHQNGRGSFNN